MKILRLSIDTASREQVEAGVRAVLVGLREDLGVENWNMEPLVGGTTNTIVKCWLEESDDEAVLVRIYGCGSDLLIDRRDEMENMEFLSRAGLGGGVMARFHNGLVYQFVAGEPVTRELVVRQDVAFMVAARMARMHALPMDMDKSTDILWRRIRKFIGLLPDIWTLGEDSKTSLLAEFEELKSNLERCESDLVFCHNDLNLPNIIYDGSGVSFIDVEYSGCSYAAFDIANHFLEFAGVEGDLDYKRFYPNKGFQIGWIRTYLDIYNSAINRPEASDETVESFYLLIQKFCLCSHLLWGVWAAIQAEVSKIHFDFSGIAAQRLAGYRSTKHCLISQCNWNPSADSTI